MPELPSGIVTFFFTDIEGSTRMVRALGDEPWAAALSTHRALVRKALVEHDGSEFGTQGDALFAAFRRATDAAGAAIAAQRSLEQHDWPDGSRIRIRLGLHSGEAVVHGANYIGKEVHRAARICDVGHGGQILVSKHTAGLIREALPPGVTLTDVGEHRLKGMDEPERLFQLTAPGLPQQFAPLRSLDAPSNLSAARSSFVGRDKEVATVCSRLERGRLVSLTGIGGAGKTRLATEVGSRELARFADGVFFVDLAPLSDSDILAQATATACAQAIGDILRGEFGGSVQDRLVTALTDRSCLLIFDNCEHLIDAVADLLDRLLAECPKITLLATSREALGVEGEQVVPIPPLAVPSEGHDPNTVDRAEAVRLFVERAAAVKPTFSLNDDNREAVVEICRRLDGLPLAIELAATRVTHLSVGQIAERLEDRFRLLTGGRRRIQRQQTLGAALDWSHELLSDDERALLRRLSVFAGGFTLEAAEAIAAGGGGLVAPVLELLASLVAKSLVVAREDSSGEVRYDLLETVRMYAADKLSQAGEAEDMRTRHRDWYLAWLEEIPIERISASVPTFNSVLTEIDNIRAGVGWSIARDEPRPLAHFAGHLRDYWNTSGSSEEGRRWLLQALDAGERLTVDERINCHAAIVFAASTLLQRQEGIIHASRVVELSAGRPSSALVTALAWRGFLTSIAASAPGMPESMAADARRDCSEAVRVAESGLDREWRIRAKTLYGMAEETLDDQHAAAREFADVLAMVDRDDESHPQFYQATAGLAVSLHLLGATAAALDAAMNGLARSGLRSYPSNYSHLMRAELAPALVAGGHEQLACEVLRDTLAIALHPGIPLVENHVLGITAVLEYLRGRCEPSARLFAASRSLGGAVGTEIPFRTPGSVALYRRYLPLVRAALGPEAARRARGEGQAMSRNEALRSAAEAVEAR